MVIHSLREGKRESKKMGSIKVIANTYLNKGRKNMLIGARAAAPLKRESPQRAPRGRRER